MIEAPETPHAPHGHGGQRWFDIVMAVAILLVSAGSLYVSLHTGLTMEALVHANERLVWAQSTPILQYDHGNVGEDGKPALEFTIRNVGTGPARVVWFEFMQGGKRYHDIGDWVRANGKGSNNFTTASISLIALAAGEQRNLLIWKKPNDAPGLSRWQAVDQARFTAHVRACYCSVFDQCWVSNLEADIPQPVADCRKGKGQTPPA